MPRTLVIMRGLPGSGKSTKARTLAPLEHICSADDYFVSNGMYQYNARLIGEAHAWCRGLANGLMIARVPVVVIDNTNIKREHFVKYLRMAARYGYTVRFEESDTPWAWDANECFRHCRHDVPLLTIERMAREFEAVDEAVAVAA